MVTMQRTKKYHFIKTVFVLFPLLGTSQNLVPNPSFEVYDTSVNYYMGSYYSKYWFSPPEQGGGSAYFNEDATNSSHSVPSNALGYQQAFGKAYQSLQYYETGTGSTDIRSYIETELQCPLITNQQYNVGFYVSLADISGFAVNQFGMYLSDTQLYHSNSLIGRVIPNIIPQIENNPNILLDDTANWMKISGVYTATGGEQYITIGGFYPDSLTNIVSVSGFLTGAYYYLDSVFVIPLDNTAGCGSVGINEVSANNIAVYPNPASSQLTFDLPANENIISVKVFNTMGQLCNAELDKNVLGITKLPQGIYMAEVQTQNRLMNVRFVKE